MKWLTELKGTNWIGNGELWLDPEGNVADLYECQLKVENNIISYSWNYEGAEKKGSFLLTKMVQFGWIVGIN